MNYPSLPWWLQPAYALKKIDKETDDPTTWAFSFRDLVDEAGWSEQRKYRETMQNLIAYYMWIDVEWARRCERYPVPDDSLMGGQKYFEGFGGGEI